MRTDEISKLVDEAHAIFNTTLVHEVIDLEKQAAEDLLNEVYDNPVVEIIDRYLEVVKRLR